MCNAVPLCLTAADVIRAASRSAVGMKEGVLYRQSSAMTGLSSSSAIVPHVPAHACEAVPRPKHSQQSAA
jgi:hypothetical protein